MRRTGGDGNDCGVTTDPVVAVPHPEAAALAAARTGRRAPPALRLSRPAAAGGAPAPARPGRS